MTPIPSLQQRIAIQGEKGSFHEIAAHKFFGNDLRLDCCPSFPALFRSLRTRKSTLAVMAIENSVAGALLPNYALLRESDFVIVGEVYLRIEHCLMALPGQQIEDIKEVHSHPMALAQCRHFFEQYPHLRLVEQPDTAGSAAWIAQEQQTGVAAVAASLAAEHYGLEILAPGIEDNPRNFTRFLILAPADQASRWERKPDKASVCFSLGHSVGSLSQILLVLSSHGMNLTKIQSSPLVGKEWEYFFHVDLLYEDLAQYHRALAAITPLVSELQVLGEYPQGDKLDTMHPVLEMRQEK
jgi:prephenate dehydratase